MKKIKTATEISIAQSQLGKSAFQKLYYAGKPIITDDDEEVPHKPFVYIRWTDACSDAHGWRSEEDAVEWASSVQWLVETSGWIIKETREFILIAQQRGDWISADDYQYSNLMKIPKTWIKLKVDLTKYI